MNLKCLPGTICCLKQLECLDLSGCSNCDNLPENLGILNGLKKVSLSGTTLKELPSSIEGLTALTLLIFKVCKNLVCLLLGSKDLGCYVFRTLICIVGKP